MRENTTDNLMRTLLNIDNISELTSYLNGNKINNYSNFAEYFFSLEKVQNMKRAELVSKSCLSREYAYEITSFNNNKKISRDRILALCIAAGLDIKETQRSLKISKLSELYSKDSRDALIIFGINHGYDVLKINELLFSYNLPSLEGTVSSNC